MQVGQGVSGRRLDHALSNTGSDTESMVEVEAGPRGGEFQAHRDVQSTDFLIRDFMRKIGFHSGFAPSAALNVRPCGVGTFPVLNI